MTKSLVRGGQINLHNLRMFKQVVMVGLGLSLLAGMGISLWRWHRTVPFYLIEQYGVTIRADFASLYSPASFDWLILDWPTGQRSTRVFAKTILGHPYKKTIQDYIHGQLKLHIIFAIWYSLYAFGVLGFWWFLKGKKSFLSKRLRGQRIVSAFSLKWRLCLRFKASDLTVENVPLVKNSETKHILVVGTTGAGKTNLFNDLIPQIAARSDKAIIIDTTGDMTAHYYDPNRGDVLINPFDNRGRYWDILSECQTDYQFDSLACSIVPQNNSYSDPIWKNGSAKLLSVALQKAKAENMTLRHLYNLLAESNLREFGYFFEGSDAFVFADPRGEKTTLSFRATLSNSIQFLKHISIDKEPFSIARWINDDQKKNWVFLTSNEDQLSTLRPLIAALFDTASTTLMSRPESQNRRVWFILDELPALQRLQSLQAILSKGRKYGAAVFAGLQSMSQFEKEYGPLDARTILNLFNTKFFFRSSEIQACDQISRWLGEEEILETQENLSYGAHEMRDGISLTAQKKQGRLVLPTEIAQLPDLVCYVQYPENTPIAKLKMSFNRRKNG